MPALSTVAVRSESNCGEVGTAGNVTSNLFFFEEKKLVMTSNLNFQNNKLVVALKALEIIFSFPPGNW